MKRNRCAVASVDGANEGSRVSKIIETYIAGLGQMVVDYIDRGFEPYMLSFMFRLAVFESRSLDEAMRETITKVYSRFLTECVRYPHSSSNRKNRPILLACQDWPVWERKKKDRIIKLPWEGAHWGVYYWCRRETI